MRHESFQTNNLKVFKIVGDNNELDNNNKDLKSTNVYFDSINFSKKNIKLPLITNKIFNSSTDFFFERAYVDFPEDFINFFKPAVIWSIGDGYNIDNLFTKSEFDERIATETAKVGDIGIFNSQFDYWYNKIDGAHISIRVHYTINIRELTSYTPGGSFGTTSIPVKVNMFLQGVNEKLYENYNRQSI